MIHRLLVLLLLLSFSSKGKQLLSQDSFTDRWEFIADSTQRYGFDHPPKKVWYNSSDRVNKNIPYVKSIRKGSSDPVLVRHPKAISTESVAVLINDSIVKLQRSVVDDSTFRLTLPGEENYLLKIIHDNEVKLSIQVNTFKNIVKELVIVSDIEGFNKRYNYQNYLDSVFNQAGITFYVNSAIFEDSLMNRTLSNPSSAHDVYTSDMRKLRDRFFDAYPNTNKDVYYLFLIEGFQNELTQAYAPQNKALLFAQKTFDRTTLRSISQELARSIGMLDEESGYINKVDFNNLMLSETGTHLSEHQWLQLRHSSNSYSYYDVDEDLITNNGTIAYYFWEQDSLGNITIRENKLLASINRPYKKNYLSYHLNISDVLFTVIYTVNNIPITWWHTIVWGLLIVVFLIVRWRFKRRWRNSPIERIKGRVIRVIVLAVTLLVGYVIHILVLAQLSRYEVHQGHIEAFDNKKYEAVKHDILYNTTLKRQNKPDLGSEILINKEDKWYVKRKKAVLYFTQQLDSNSNISALRFQRDDDQLTVPFHNIDQKAESHYFVVQTIDQKGTVLNVSIFNHVGIEVSGKLDGIDPAKRILLFVNGYRPTSTGHSFEENFEDAITRGLEHPASKNLIYSFDRYDYWQPWFEMDDRFGARVNPNATYYADGHFSVSTSNHRSLVQFTKLASTYPDRCKDPKNHTCNELNINTGFIFGSSTSPTTDLLPTISNMSGFKERRENGRIAGVNLNMLLNELPNNSQNDTLYIVAHSMGYAYSLGIIDELRGKINFGEFYILSPENASAGGVRRSEWKQIWQYGSDLSEDGDAPCLQDGIAPQTSVDGLNEDQRIYIPETEYKRKGFFDSHFIGYYRWVFDIPAGEKGYIPQR